MGRPLQVAARKYAARVAVEDQAQQQPWVLGRLARATVAAGHGPQVQSLDPFRNEPREVALRQPLIDRWRHQEVPIAVDRAEVTHAALGPEGGANWVRGFYRLLPRRAKSDRLPVPLVIGFTVNELSLWRSLRWLCCGDIEASAQ
jgi:hypothetical protein